MISSCQLFSFSKLFNSLKEVTEPDGYRPFKINKKANQILRQELATQFEKTNFFERNRGTKEAVRYFFSPLGIEITATPKVANQMTLPEATTYYLLYNKIANGTSSMKIEGDEAFKNELLQSIKTLLSIPSGRSLIQSIATSKIPVIFDAADYAHVESVLGEPIKVFFDFKSPAHLLTIGADGDKEIEVTPSVIMVAHELIHVLFDIEIAKLYSIEDKSIDILHELKTGIEIEKTPATLKQYDNLAELLAIEGVKGKNYISEQMIRYELGLPRRYGHVGSSFGPIHPGEDPNEIHESSSRVWNAANLGAAKETKTLLMMKADPNTALRGAAGGGHVELMRDLIVSYGASANSRTHGYSPVHSAAREGELAALMLLKDMGADLDATTHEGKTALHMACEEKNTKIIEYLVQQNVKLNQKTKEPLQLRPIDILVTGEGPHDAVDLLVKSGAKLSRNILKKVPHLRKNRTVRRNIQIARLHDAQKRKRTISPLFMWDLFPRHKKTRHKL